MKITHMTSTQCLLLLAACLPIAAQMEINPDHYAESNSAVATPLPRHDAEIRTLQAQLESYQQRLQAKMELVEQARQEAISAGIQGDGAGPFIDASRQEQKELEALQAALAPKIEQTHAMIAALTMPVAPSDSAPTSMVRPARPARALVIASNSHEVH